MALTASYIAACMIAKLRVGCTVAGCAPGVRTIVRSVLFHCITSSSDPAAESAWAKAPYTSEAHVSASEVQDRIGLSPPFHLRESVERDIRLSRLACEEDFNTEGFIPSSVGGVVAGRSSARIRRIVRWACSRPALPQAKIERQTGKPGYALGAVRHRVIRRAR